MDRSDVSEADLLRAFAALQDSELDAAAEVIGFTRISIPKSKGPAPREQSKQPPGPVTTRSQPKERIGPEGPPEAPYFWRIASDLPIGARATTGPAWLGTQQPIDDESIEASSFAAVTVQPLASAHRFATFIRRHLAVAMRSTEPNTHVAVQRISRGEALTDCPALTRHRWPGGVHLIIDASSHLWPLAFDMGVLTSELERLLGQRLRIFRSLGTPAAIQDADMRPANVPADGAPVIVLGDAALLGPDAARQGAWLAWGLQQQLAGRRALLLAPVQASAITRELAEAFDVVPLGQGGGLRLMAGGKRAQVDSSPAEAQALEPPAALLRDLLYGNSYVVPALLRALRRLLQAHGHELGVAAEVNVWRHSSVIRDPGGCTLHPSHRDEVRLRLLELKRELLLAALALHWDALHDASPLVRSEFAQWWAALLLDRVETGPWRAALAQGIDDAEQLMRRIATALWTQPGERCSGLTAYLRRLGSRSPSLLGASEGHQLAWTLAQRDSIASGAVQMPGTIDLSVVGWVLGNDAANQPMSLVIQGDSPTNPGRVRLGWSDELPPSMSRLADRVMVGKLWSAEFLPAARERTLRWMRALSQLLSDRRQSAGLPAVYVTVQDWERSVALNEGGIGTPTDASGRAVRKEEPRRLGPVHEWVLKGMTTERMKHLRAAQDEVEKRVLEARRDDLSMERLAHELWAWLRAFRTNEATQNSSVDDLPALLFMVLAGGDLETVHQLAELPLQARQHMQQGFTADLSPGHACTLRLPNRTLVLGAAQRPAWAESIWRDEAGLMAEVAGGRRLRWCPATTSRLIDAAEGAEYRLPLGCWWDEEEQQDFFLPIERTLRRPSWAVRHGVDDHGYWAEFEVQHIVQRMRFVPPGRFWMGSPLAEDGHSENGTLHPVTLTRGFWLADTTCTRELWQAVTGTLPKGLRGTDANLPVVEISHDDITRRFLPTLKRHLPGFNGRLPSEAEWEYAARAGTQTAFPWGDVADPERMNFGAAEKQDAGRVLPVRSFTPNLCGLWQMHGNVWEWCSDGLVDYPTNEALDPIAGQSARRVLRGGSWFDLARNCRSARRSAYDPGHRNGLVGFRLARGLPEAGWAEPNGHGAPALPTEPAAFSERPERPSLADKLKPSAAPKRGSRQPLPSDKKRKK